MSIEIAHSALEGLATLLTPATGTFAAALAIVLFTAAVRLLISPLTWLQIRTARKAAGPGTLAAARGGPDPGAPGGIGAGPFVALLPALAQAPFFILMFHLVRPGPGEPTGLLAGQLFGVPLTAHLAAGLPVFAVLLLVAGLLAWWTSRRTRRSMPPGSPIARIAGWVPYLGVAAVAWLPLAVGLYLVTSTAWSALEQLVLRR
ncbi:protein translocase component YidC [Actinoplanes sp. NBRC 14428]|nr:protein translocase component YidC [Actinoplanes sp. NBRC 14428]